MLQTLLRVSVPVRVHVGASGAKLGSHRATAPFFPGKSAKYVQERGLRSASTQSSADASELNKFGELAAQWWDSDSGPFAALHSMNYVRVPLIVDAALRRPGAAGSGGTAAGQPLQGLSVLDVGCGGGILSEALGRLGADVTGLDAEPRNVAVAQTHYDAYDKDDTRRPPRVQYVASTAEELLEARNSFDVVVASEVVEHVTDVKSFVKSCVELTAPGGALVFTTINRTLASNVLAIGVAEHVLGLLPVGTHSHSKFVTPSELKQALLAAHPGVEVNHDVGLLYNPLTKAWSTVGGLTAVNYGLTAFRQPARPSQ